MGRQGIGVHMRNMIRLLILAMIFGGPTWLGAQSLGAVAKKEKERREELRKSGKTGRVLSEADLAQGEDETRPDGPEDQRQESTAPPRADERSTQETEITLDSVIPPAATLAERNRIFDRLKQLYQRETENIDVTIRTNELRLTEIERELSALGAGGLPVATTATQATTPTSGLEFQPLMEERKKLTEQNEQLRRQKEDLKSTLLDKGRRGGIAAGTIAVLRPAAPGVTGVTGDPTVVYRSKRRVTRVPSRRSTTTTWSRIAIDSSS